MPKLKIYADQRFLAPNRTHVQMLFPFWGLPPEEEANPKKGRFDRYTAMGRDFFEMCSLAEADIVIYPQEWRRGQEDVGELGRLAREAGKPLVIFFNNDSDELIPVEESVIFRTSLYRSRRRPNEFALPAWSEDIVERYCDGRLPIRPKGPHPVVGYCGYSKAADSNLLKKFARNLLRRGGGVHRGQVIRSRALALLSQQDSIKANFLIRDAYWGGALDADGFDPVRAAQVREEFVTNMLNSDYIVCSRGGGNFSYRIYETLSCGRIPIFIDTDCVLPYEAWIDWKQYCVWVSEEELDQIGDMVVEFHHRLSDEDFEGLQYEFRRLWLDWISPEGFFGNFHRHFPEGGRTEYIIS